MAHLKAAVAGETVLVASNSNVPESADWDAYMKILAEHLTRRAGQPGRLVVFAGGGTPTSAHRLQLRDVVAKRPLLTAVITESMAVRGIISVFSLFVDGTKPFSTREWRQALEYVGFPMDQLPAAQVSLRELDKDVAGCSAAAEFLKAAR